MLQGFSNPQGVCIQQSCHANRKNQMRQADPYCCWLCIVYWKQNYQFCFVSVRTSGHDSTLACPSCHGNIPPSSTSNFCSIQQCQYTICILQSLKKVHTVAWRIPAPVEGGSLSHYLPGFIHPRWLAGFLPWTLAAFLCNMAFDPGARGFWYKFSRWDKLKDKYDKYYSKSRPRADRSERAPVHVRKLNRFHWGHWGKWSCNMILQLVGVHFA